MTHFRKIREQVDQIAGASGRDPAEITLIAVSKNQTVESIKRAYDEGCRNFGENRLQEAIEKVNLLPADIIWHFIGNLQSNKVSKTMTHFPLIHSVDSLPLAEKISALSVKNVHIQRILLEINILGETAKHGFSINECQANLDKLLLLPNLAIEGFMAMAPLTEDANVIRTCFRNLRMLKDNFRERANHPSWFRHLSMGMSQDYPIAIEEGATLLRIGSAIFK